MATSKKAVAVKAPVKTVSNPPARKKVASPQVASKVVTELNKAVSSLAPLSRATARLSSAKLAGDISNLDFRAMIGGPLQAAIDAQIASSIASVNFIKDVGFTEVDGKKELVYVDFTHEQITLKVPPAGGDPVEEKETKRMKVPFLAMLQIPSLRIEYVDINFKAKLNSVETEDVSTKLGVTVEGKAGWGPVSIKVAASYQRQSSTGVRIEKEFALDIKVRAVQDEIPRGLEIILNSIN